jgi:NAD(P)-dependent dehydrogenase (short-subunit alcohol dehydrogenase family)
MTQVVLITGASQGIGKATALELARQGYDLILAARKPDRLEAVAEEVRALGRQALAISTDVRDSKQVDELVRRAIEHFGRVDILVNNAGIFYLGPVESASLEDWQQIIQTNLWGYIYTIHALLPHFLERHNGTIVNIGSIGGLNAIPYQVPYTTSKYAVTGLTKSLQAELAPKGIHVCGIYPSFISSQLQERALFRGGSAKTANDRYELVNRALRSPFLEKPEDVARAVVKAIRHPQKDIQVGTAKIWTTAFHLVPQLIQPLVRRVLGMGEIKKRAIPTPSHAPAPPTDNV